MKGCSDKKLCPGVGGLTTTVTGTWRRWQTGYAMSAHLQKLKESQRARPSNEPLQFTLRSLPSLFCVSSVAVTAVETADTGFIRISVRLIRSAALRTNRATCPTDLGPIVVLRPYSARGQRITRSACHSASRFTISRSGRPSRCNASAPEDSAALRSRYRPQRRSLPAAFHARAAQAARWPEKPFADVVDIVSWPRISYIEHAQG
jgi:hypothetical protein